MRAKQPGWRLFVTAETNYLFISRSLFMWHAEAKFARQSANKPAMLKQKQHTQHIEHNQCKLNV